MASESSEPENSDSDSLPRNVSMLILGTLIGGVATCCCFAVLPSATTDHHTAGAVLDLKVAHALPESHPVHHGILKLQQRLEELSNGQVTLTIYPSEQLGNETECLEKVQRGSLAITKVSAAPLGNFVPRMKVFSLPYLFRSDDHFWQVLDGDLGLRLLSDLAIQDDGSPSGFLGLCYFDAGSRNFYGKKGLVTPGDLKGIKVRVMNDPVAMDMVDALGGSPAPISMGELYTALKQGVVDAAENNPPTFIASRHYEVCKHFTFDRHSRIPDVLVISSSTWQSLTTKQRQWLQEAARDASKHQRTIWRQQSEAAIAQMREHGVQIHEADQSAFAEKSKPVRAQYSSGILADLVEQIRSRAP